MCDYSLELYQKRDAEVGETLTAHKYPSSTIGLKSDKTDASCATCVTPGTLLRLDFPDGRCDTAIFSKLDVPESHRHVPDRFHRDGLILSGGENLNLQNLPVGTRATILMLADAKAPEDAALASTDAAGSTPVADFATAE